MKALRYSITPLLYSAITHNLLKTVLESHYDLKLKSPCVHLAKYAPPKLHQVQPFNLD
jgi:hypothetical protein